MGNSINKRGKRNGEATLIFAGVIIPTTTEDDELIFNVEVSVFVYESTCEITGTIKERMTKKAKPHIA